MDELAAAPSRRPRWMLTLVAGVLVAAATITTYVVTRPSEHQATAEPAPVVAPPTPGPTPGPTTAAPTPTPAPKPVTPHDVVAAAAPKAFTISGPGFTITAHVCSMAPVFPLDPPGEQHHRVCWVTKGFGVAPGSSSGTSYVLGHSWAEDRLEVLNKLSSAATREVLEAKATEYDGVPVYPARSLTGTKITLRTRKGTLTYAVRTVYGVDKLKLGQIKTVMNAKIRNRVVLITCAELNGRDYDYNIVAEAYLVSSAAAATA